MRNLRPRSRASPLQIAPRPRSINTESLFGTPATNTSRQLHHDPLEGDELTRGLVAHEAAGSSTSTPALTPSSSPSSSDKSYYLHRSHSPPIPFPQDDEIEAYRKNGEALHKWMVSLVQQAEEEEQEGSFSAKRSTASSGCCPLCRELIFDDMAWHLLRSQDHGAMWRRTVSNNSAMEEKDWAFVIHLVVAIAAAHGDRTCADEQMEQFHDMLSYLGDLRNYPLGRVRYLLQTSIWYVRLKTWALPSLLPPKYGSNR